MTSIYLSRRDCYDRTHVTSDSHQRCGRQDDDDRASVVQAEDVVVDASLVPFVEQARHGAKDHVEHLERFTICSLVVKKSTLQPSRLTSRSPLPEIAVDCWTLPCEGFAAPIRSVRE